MKKVKWWLISIPFVLLSILFIAKGIDLNNKLGMVDGEGIGVYFIGLEINDSVSSESIQYYTRSFFIAGILTTLVSMILMVKTLRLR